MAEKLEAVGFDVSLIEDITAARLIEELDALAQRTGENGVALFYFAGFSAQLSQQVHLLPVDAQVAADRKGFDRSVPINQVTRTLSRAGRNASNIVVIDAMPYPAQPRYRGIEVSSVSIVTPPNFLIAYSNSAVTPEEANKAQNRLLPYTDQLLRAIDTPKQTVEEVFKNVRVAISETTSRGQIPWHTSSLLSDVYLVPAAGSGTDVALKSANRNETRGIRVKKSKPASSQVRVEDRKSDSKKTAQASEQSPEFERALWGLVKDSKNAADFEAYLEVFPKGQYAKEARKRMLLLRAKKVVKPTVAPPNVSAMEAELAANVTANVRKQPDRSAAILGKIERGDTVEVTGRVVGKNWYRIEREDGSTGYVSASVLTKRKAAKPAPPPTKPKVAVIAPKPPKTTPQAAPGKTFRDCPDCPEMVVIPSGIFRMGSNAGDGSEGPVRTVRIAKSFAIGRYEVTIADWNACVEAGGCSYKPKVKKAQKNAPVHRISWQDAQKYLAWISKKTGYRYRLPSEAEWEYAARGGSGSRYWWGNRMSVGMADCKECGGDWSYSAPAPVGKVKANAFGLYGVSGGVWEWTDDCWRHGFDRAPTDGTASTVGNCNLRVLRGGSWRNNAEYAHTTSRFKYDFNVRYSTNGFRVVRDMR